MDLYLHPQRKTYRARFRRVPGNIVARGDAETSPQFATVAKVTLDDLLERAKNLPETATLLDAQSLINVAVGIKPRLNAAQQEMLLLALKATKIPGAALGQLRKMWADTVVQLMNDRRSETPDYRDLLIKDAYGSPKGNEANILAAFTNDPDLQSVLSYDEFTKLITFVRRPPWESNAATPWVPRVLVEGDLTLFAAWLQTRGIPASKTIVADCIVVAAAQNSTDALKDYLNGLRWDGVPRVSSWLETYLGVPKSPYSRAAGRWWMISGAARGLDAGCKVDHLLILESEQGMLKSSVWRTLVPFEAWHGEISGAVDEKDTLMGMDGVWIIVFGELSSFSKKQAIAGAGERLSWARSRSASVWARVSAVPVPGAWHSD